MKHQDIRIGKSILILVIFSLIIAVFQVSRMGLLENTRGSLNLSYSADGAALLDAGQADAGQAGMELDSVEIGVYADGRDPNKSYLLQQMMQYLNHLPYEYTQLETINEAALKNCDIVIAFLTDFEDGDTFYRLMEYAKEGGKVYFPYLPVDEDTYLSNLHLLGVIERDYEDTTVYQITDEAGILGRADQLYVIPEGFFEQTRVRLSSSCRVLLSTEDTPCFWQLNYGSGMLYAGTLEALASAQGRGIAAWVLYDALFAAEDKAMVLPFYDISTTLLLDFPVPVYTTQSRVLEELQQDEDEFMQTSFYKLFLDWNVRTGEKISMSYTVNTDEEFNEIFRKSLNRSQFMMYSSEILDTGGELLTGGYTNHPLGLAGELEEIGYFIPWVSRDRMAESFDFALEYVNEYYSNYQVTGYVLPQGRIGRDTLSEISTLFPGVRTVVNRGKIEYPDQLLEDFTSLDEDEPYLYSIMAENGWALWGNVNSVLSLGIASQGYSCQELLTEQLSFSDFRADLLAAEEWLSQFSLRAMTIQEATDALREYQQASVTVSQQGQTLRFALHQWREGMAFQLRTDRIPVSQDCEILDVGGIYLVYPHQEEGVIQLEGGTS